MGYYVSSVTVISPDDNHNYFAYYLPTTRLRYEWINEFFTSNFSLIADKIGPEGVIVAPTVNASEEYSSELIRLLEEFYPMGRSARFIHSGFPFLVVSRRPIASGTIHGSKELECVALNLAAVRDEEELRNLVDTLILACLSRVDDILPLASGLAKDLSKEHNDEHGWSFSFKEAVEIKPNVFGIGINVSSILSDMHRNIKIYRQRKLNKEIGPI